MFNFIKTRLFTRLVPECLSDGEYQALQKFLVKQPKAGTVIPGTAGVRKLRGRAAGRGRSGGYRVIYFARVAQGEIWMLTVYPKNVKDDIPAHVLSQIRRAVEDA